MCKIAVMSPSPNPRRFLRSVLALFLIGQALAFAHVSDVGQAHSEHCGTLCVAMLSDEPDALLPVTQTDQLMRLVILDRAFPALVDSDVAVVFATLPPATGPPLS